METKESGETREQLETFIADLKEQLAIHPDNKAYKFDLAEAELRLAGGIYKVQPTIGSGDNDADDGNPSGGQDNPANPDTN
ncbi:MAG: hypothetical protein P4L31_07505 [Candidatus Babeliales bacterium]|nr:hypothetical protein [Candidatus Babeliales bacterium]